MTLERLRRIVPENSIRFLGHDTHEHDAPHLIHVVAGRADMVVDGREFTLGARHNLWLAPHVPHAMRLRDGGMALGPMLSPNTLPPERVHRLGVVPAVTRVMMTVLGAAPATPEQIVPFREALDAVLLGPARQRFPVSMPEHPVARAVAREAAASDATLDELARRHHASVRHVQRLFVEQTGLSFTRWRTRARLNTALARIHAGYGLAEAARASGYLTRSGLLRALRRETGLPEHLLAADPLAAVDGVRTVA
ncbi:helix-turn-helix domain-containing protein [Nocardiopsis sp. N85]|uniref:helix-turn-helix transcriptional regulator n=1 Tax=Nocardiopsis sp. N85 TaxID=3029400 RepID=UPI00237F23CA|nr:helix-turn-helix domain-containing protein [Nocardiopsis sp. N85]MDE3721826.1 helix-turn-helix domain-containing protein [Nocardiopsis sp. N85]